MDDKDFIDGWYDDIDYLNFMRVKDILYIVSDRAFIEIKRENLTSFNYSDTDCDNKKRITFHVGENTHSFKLYTKDVIKFFNNLKLFKLNEMR